MKPFQERVLKEREELETKVIALRNFLHSPSRDSLSEDEWVLLVRQLEYMCYYLNTLDRRIALFK